MDKKTKHEVYNINYWLDCNFKSGIKYTKYMFNDLECGSLTQAELIEFENNMADMHHCITTQVNRLAKVVGTAEYGTPEKADQVQAYSREVGQR